MIKIIRNKGMPKYESFGNGDLFIRFNVIFPDDDFLTPDIKKKLKNIFNKDESIDDLLEDDNDFNLLIDPEEYNDNSNSYDEDPNEGNVQCQQQ